MALNTVREGEIESLSNSSSSDIDSSGLIGFWIEGMSYNLDTTTLIDGSNFELSSDGKNIQNGSVSYQQNNVNSLGYLKIPVQPEKQYYIGIKYSVSSEGTYDKGWAFVTDNESLAGQQDAGTQLFSSGNGTNNSSVFPYTSPSGSNFCYVTFRYNKDGSNSSNDDRFYIYRFVFCGDNNLAQNLLSSNDLSSYIPSSIISTALFDVYRNSGTGSSSSNLESATGILPVTNGGTGTDDLANVNVGSATVLETARNIIASLGSTTAGSFNGSKAVTVGTQGTLPVARGGTGQTVLSAVTVGKASSLETARNIIASLNSSVTASFNGSEAVTVGTQGTLPINKGGTGTTTATPMFYGTCSTAAGTVAKVVTCSGFVLTTGAQITVKFTTTSTATAPTLNVNSTGAKTIQYMGYSLVSGALRANGFYHFCYDGTYWQVVGPLVWVE